MYVSSLQSVFEHYYKQNKSWAASTYAFWLQWALKYCCMLRSYSATRLTVATKQTFTFGNYV